jgi:hypothetical protein
MPIWEKAAERMKAARRLLRMRGPWFTLRAILAYLLDPDRLIEKEGHAFDRKYGVETTSTVERSLLDIEGESAEHAVAYIPTSVRSFSFMMKYLKISYSEYIFVDIGAGKGRVLLLASSFPFKKIIGVEASPHVCKLAKRNLRTYKSPSQKCKDMEMVLCDALDFAMPGDNTVFYLCNPFGPLILRRFLEKLECSLQADPRDVFVVYDYPWSAYSVFEEFPFLKLMENFVTIAPDYTWCYYRNVKYARPPVP